VYNEPLQKSIQKTDASAVEAVKIPEIIKPWLERQGDQGMFIISSEGVNIASMRDTNLGQLNFFSGYKVWGEDDQR
jgi:hypothetical protein